MLDMIATTLMYIGLTMTYASSFQMLRGIILADLLNSIIITIIYLIYSY